MRVTTYSTKLDKDNLNILVKEKSVNYQIDSINMPEKVVKLMNDLFDAKNLAEEHFYMIALNTKSKVLGVFDVFHGAVDMSLAQPREVFIRALLCGASSIILVHNHPSGDSNPSREDLMVTKKMKEVGNLIGIRVSDHVIIGDHYTSLLETDNM